MALHTSFSRMTKSGLTMSGGCGRRLYSRDGRQARAATFDKRHWNVRYEIEGKPVEPEPKKQKILDQFKFEMDVESMIRLYKKIDFSWQGFKNFFKRFDKDFEMHTQRYIEKRHKILGPDLASAHFVVFRGGGVRFVGQTKFHRRDEDDSYVLPNKFVPNVVVEALDLEGVHILFDGMVNLENLRELRWLSLRGCSEVDDWFCDRLARYRNSLEYLDISNCSKVTDRGVACLHRLRYLKTLKLDNLPQFENSHLVRLLLEDVLPNCVVTIGGGEGDPDVRVTS